MQLFYTVSSEYLAAQSKSMNSLGGYVSSTKIPNDVFGNLFDELSLRTVKDAKTEYRAIVLKNESDKIIQNVQLWFVIPEDAYCSCKIGATLLNQNEDGSQYMESVPSIYSAPFNTQLYDATEDDKVTIGNMEPGQMIGLWISRSVDKEKAIEDYNNVAERDLTTQSRYKPVTHNKEETLSLEISWD